MANEEREKHITDDPAKEQNDKAFAEEKHKGAALEVSGRAEEDQKSGLEQQNKHAGSDEYAARGERNEKLQRGEPGAEELKKDRAVSDDEATNTEQKHKDGELSAHAEQRAKAEAVNIDTEARARMEEDRKAIGEDKMKADDTSAARSESGQKISAEQSTKRYGSATSSGEAEGEGAAGPRVPKVI